MRGSPAFAYGLAPTNFITHVNGRPTPDLDTFLTETHKVPDNTYFRLKVMTFDNVPWVATMKKNEHYFPTMEFVQDSGEELGWRKVVHEADGKGKGVMGEEMLTGGTAVENDADGDGVEANWGRMSRL
jgi:hypothetical protein